ncbi:MAG: hypothetical protein ABIN01_17790 [Ferruginibacter sp.]
MIAYNSEWLKNLFIRQQAEEAFSRNCIAKDELDNIKSQYLALFYSPNFFIRVGMFVLTTVILLFSFGIFLLFFLDSVDNIIGGLAIFFGFISYAALEYFIATKKHFQSGVDDALLWVSASSIFGGISYLSNAGEIANCVIIFIISVYCSVRFADRLMSILSYVSLLGIFYFSLTKAGPSSTAVVPFVMMAISAIVYIVAKKIKSFNISWLYKDCLQIVSIAALLSFYFSGNYFVVFIVKEFAKETSFAQNVAVPFGWVFWIFTFVIPFIYIIRGIKTKDIVLIRVGLLLVAAILLTVQYFFSLLPAEVLMGIAGIVLILVSFGLTRYLKTTKHGFINEEETFDNINEKSHIEALLQAQTLSPQLGISERRGFGGGDFGGGGASSDF